MAKQVQAKTVIRWMLLVWSFVSMTACGFHLRGAYQLPPQMSQTYIQANNQNSELVRSLKRSLKANNVLLVENSAAATAVLTIMSEAQNKRVLSVDAQGRAREYELSYLVSFNLQANESDFRMTPQQLKLEREFLFDTEDILGKGREESMLIKDMQQDMVRLILLRLQSAGSGQ